MEQTIETRKADSSVTVLACRFLSQPFLQQQMYQQQQDEYLRQQFLLAEQQRQQEEWMRVSIAVPFVLGGLMSPER